jgi:hypothetical protein
LHEIDIIQRNTCQIFDNGVEIPSIITWKVFPDNYPKNKIKDYFEHEAQIASLALAKDECNQASGCLYFTIDWNSLQTEYVKNGQYQDNDLIFEENIHIREFIDMVAIRNIEKTEIDRFLVKRDNYSFLIESFYFGLISNNDKSKFFNFFIVLEYLENSENYKHLFDNDRLFTKDEQTEIINFADHFDDRKKGILHEYLRHTNKSRKEKLFDYLSTMNINCITSGEIVLSDINDIITQRNKLFHSSEKFSQPILYMKLFPLVKEIVVKEYIKDG